MDKKKLFDAIRAIKGSALTQADVDRVNAALSDTSSAMRPSKAAIDLIHSFEAIRLTAYKDPGSANGLPITNGWGTTRDENGGPIPLGAQWTREKADKLFARDIAEFGAGVAKLVPTATQNQFDALVSFAYNVGLKALDGSTLLKKHKAGDYEGAKAEFSKWVKNDGRVLNGLVRRRAAEAALYGAV